jgi:hypothetical protein
VSRATTSSSVSKESRNVGGGAIGTGLRRIDSTPITDAITYLVLIAIAAYLIKTYNVF